MRTRTIDLLLATVASAAALGLSWPYWRDFSSWPESRVAWAAYFCVGLVLAVNDFHVLIVVARTLFEYDVTEHAEAAAKAGEHGSNAGEAPCAAEPASSAGKRANAALRTRRSA